MPIRTSAITMIAATLLWGCAGDGNDADPGPGDRPNADNFASAPDTTVARGNPDPDADPGVSTSITSGWSAEITGADDAELPAVGGPAVLVSRTPA